MILATEELAAHRGRMAMVDGGFDPLHAGHVRYFEEAHSLGAPVLCNVSGDAYVSRKHPPLLPEDQRVLVIDALRPVDYTHLSRTTTADVLRALCPRFYVKGRDWADRLPGEELAACEEVGTEVVFLDTVLDSSTALLERYRASWERSG